MLISELTRGEKLQVKRRRDDVTMDQAAADYEVSLYLYRRWERDEVEDAPNVALGQLTDLERAFLYRKRSGRSFAETAADIGVSRWWLRQMELGAVNPERLLIYWKLV